MDDYHPARMAATVALFFIIAVQAGAGASSRDGGPANNRSAPMVSDDAAEAEFRSGYAACLKEHPAVRPSEECTADEINYQNARLDAEYNAALKRVHGPARDALQADQARWSQALNNECLVFSRRHGSLNSMKAQDCFLYGAARRRVRLRQEYAF